MPSTNNILTNKIAKTEEVINLVHSALQLKAAYVLEENLGDVVNTTAGLNKRRALALKVIINQGKEEAETLARLIMIGSYPEIFIYVVSAEVIYTDYLALAFLPNGSDTWNYLSGVNRSEI